MESLYMKHMGLRLRDMRMRYEVDHERRQVHAELPDGFDSYLFVSFCRAIEKNEGVRLIDIAPFGIEKQRVYSVTVAVFESAFYADLVRVTVESNVITVALRPVSESI